MCVYAGVGGQHWKSLEKIESTAAHCDTHTQKSPGCSLAGLTTLSRDKRDVIYHLAYLQELLPAYMSEVVFTCVS